VAEIINPNTGVLAFRAAFRSAGFMLSSYVTVRNIL
jgi:hypothetical protein